MILIVGGIIIFLISLLIVAFLQEKPKGWKFFRVIIFSPNVIAPVVLAAYWAFVYNPRFGIINSFLRLLHLDVITKSWTGPGLVFWAVLVIIIWLYVGFFMIILLAGANKIPITFYEVARLEGANRFQMFTKITIPMIWDVLTIAVILWGITTIKMFELQYAFGGLYPPREIWTGAVYMYLLAFGSKEIMIYRMGYGISVAVILLLLVIIFVALVGAITRREKIEY